MTGQRKKMILKLKNGNTIKVKMTLEHRNNDGYLMDDREIEDDDLYQMPLYCLEFIVNSLNYKLTDLDLLKSKQV